MKCSLFHLFDEVLKLTKTFSIGKSCWWRGKWNRESVPVRKTQGYHVVCALHVVLLKWTMCILLARFNNVKNICVLKDFIYQGGRPKNPRTCMLVGWGSRHFAAEAMESKVPAKVLICNFVLPREQMWSLSTTPSSPLTTWCNYSTHS